MVSFGSTPVTGALVSLALVALPGCFDPQVPAECQGRICGSVMDASPGGEGGALLAPAGAGGLGGQGGEGGYGGQGGAVSGISVAIVHPLDGQSFGHGEPVIFEAVVTTNGAPPSADQLLWRSDAIQELFGVGYTFTRPLSVVGTHQMTVNVLDLSDTVVAEDSIQLDAL
jgi:hypothetical protein